MSTLRPGRLLAALLLLALPALGAIVVACGSGGEPASSASPAASGPITATVRSQK